MMAGMVCRCCPGGGCCDTWFVGTNAGGDGDTPFVLTNSETAHRVLGGPTSYSGINGDTTMTLTGNATDGWTLSDGTNTWTAGPSPCPPEISTGWTRTEGGATLSYVRSGCACCDEMWIVIHLASDPDGCNRKVKFIRQIPSGVEWTALGPTGSGWRIWLHDWTWYMTGLDGAWKWGGTLDGGECPTLASQVSGSDEVELIYLDCPEPNPTACCCEAICLRGDESGLELYHCCLDQSATATGAISGTIKTYFGGRVYTLTFSLSFIAAAGPPGHDNCYLQAITSDDSSASNSHWGSFTVYEVSCQDDLGNFFPVRAQGVYVAFGVGVCNCPSANPGQGTGQFAQLDFLPAWYIPAASAPGGLNLPLSDRHLNWCLGGDCGNIGGHHFTWTDGPFGTDGDVTLDDSVINSNCCRTVAADGSPCDGTGSPDTGGICNPLP